ncbi:MAG: Na+/H+ antiporter NhaA, partial [Alphaproteobacteria bacterium]|nr:Na+/H+ antiporter NhaA [Alphaproteobacteria bacterium]
MGNIWKSLASLRNERDKMRAIHRFFQTESTAGIILGITALLALIIQNSPLSSGYQELVKTPLTMNLIAFTATKPLVTWINDGLMAVFFFLVGLEFKRELLLGNLSSKKQRVLPALAAVGGLCIPAVIYSAFNWGNAMAMNGWAIPAATDIAFALGTLILLGKRIPESLKVTLVAIAILDDLAAIIIIALFYTDHISLESLMVASLCMLLLFCLNKRKVSKVWPYLAIGFVFWLSVLRSGVHATLAGVILAFF